MPELRAFERAKSMMRDLPPKKTAGFARRSVSSIGREPRPPASTQAMLRRARWSPHRHGRFLLRAMPIDCFTFAHHLVAHRGWTVSGDAPASPTGAECPGPADGRSVAAAVAAKLGRATVRYIGIGRPIARGLSLLRTASAQDLGLVGGIWRHVAVGIVVRGPAGTAVEGVRIGGAIALGDAAARRLRGNGKSERDCKADGQDADLHDVTSAE